MKIDGRCHCGNLSFEAEVDPESVEICHCADCQTLSGSAFRVVVPAIEGSFRLLSGVPKTYVKTAASGNKRIQAFCPDCGTQIYATAADATTKVFGLRVGAIRQRDVLVPRANIGIGQPKVGWIKLTNCPALKPSDTQFSRSPAPCKLNNLTACGMLPGEA